MCACARTHTHTQSSISHSHTWQNINLSNTHAHNHSYQTHIQPLHYTHIFDHSVFKKNHTHTRSRAHLLRYTLTHAHHTFANTLTFIHTRRRQRSGGGGEEDEEEDKVLPQRTDPWHQRWQLDTRCHLQGRGPHREGLAEQCWLSHGRPWTDACSGCEVSVVKSVHIKVTTAGQN